MVTNYERIKNMSIEEMAEKLVYITFFTQDEKGAAYKIPHRAGWEAIQPFVRPVSS